jgi:hypothetical protein
LVGLESSLIVAVHSITGAARKKDQAGKAVLYLKHNLVAGYPFWLCPTVISKGSRTSIKKS